jgi:hypothetical protein
MKQVEDEPNRARSLIGRIVIITVVVVVVVPIVLGCMYGLLRPIFG